MHLSTKVRCYQPLLQTLENEHTMLQSIISLHQEGLGFFTSNDLLTSKFYQAEGHSTKSTTTKCNGISVPRVHHLNLWDRCLLLELINRPLMLLVRVAIHAVPMF